MNVTSATGGLDQSAAVAVNLDGNVATVLPKRPAANAPVPRRRAVGGVAARDVFVVVGAVISALCTTLLLFGRLTQMSGKLAFTVVFFVLFVAIYALLVSLHDNGPAVVDKVMTALLGLAASVAGGALVSVVLFVLVKGRHALIKTNLYTQDMSAAGPQDPISVGGISHAIVGTLVIISLCLLFTVPLGLTCAVYLNETRGRLTNFVRTVVTSMTALPSILAGLFIFATWILILGNRRSALAASIAVSIMMLPIIIRSADVILRLVPGNLREASQALGSSQWRTVWHVVLPTARSGLSTSVILGVARGVGETAPVLLTSGITSTLNFNPRENPMMSLPLAAYEFIRSPQPALVQRGYATAAVLLILVLMLFTVARFLGGRPAGQLSHRQARRREASSTRDAERFDARLLQEVS